jgi:predicted metal-dependent hydrolase
MKKNERISQQLEETGLNGTEERPLEYLAYFECFNRGEYYEAHDVLEHLWLREKGPDYAFYKGLIQFAGAFVHLKKHFESPDHPKHGRRLAPASRLFLLAETNLAAFAPTRRGLNVLALIQRSASLREALHHSAYTVNPWSPTHRPTLLLMPVHE